MYKLTYEEVDELKWALSDIEGYLTDNSCGDPDCCSGPYYTAQEFNEAVTTLNKFNLDFKQ